MQCMDEKINIEMDGYIHGWTDGETSEKMFTREKRKAVPYSFQLIKIKGMIELENHYLVSRIIYGFVGKSIVEKQDDYIISK